ncbi:hypothetical protein ACH46N_25305 [Streptomyces pristinaespiralis]|uniref:AG1 protein n=2 Tax=Streptomyces pristinaespiralis TaxID=38300 RepID=B5HDE3_STRE2|nr:hypothetical protein [Streptomyces pristinaespiralis]ALC22919.1 AG1 protein [Streptomyces pristinaespiralis]EDY64854.1 AG1 protein [Streptomyces pristinaespiralis ATCC 25486]QMU14540.1 hypothetical protein H3L99_13795 [Streptomyces pristinaespiralis]
MTFDDEWAAARAGASRTVAMRLGHSDGGGGSPAVGADLSVNQDDLGAVGHDAYVLHGRLSRDGDHARPSTFEAANALANGNFVSGPELLKVHDRWNTQLRALLDACGQISNHLDHTRTDHADNDADIVGRLTAVATLDKYFK